jgi:hypothetical protein
MNYDSARQKNPKERQHYPSIYSNHKVKFSDIGRENEHILVRTEGDALTVYIGEYFVISAKERVITKETGLIMNSIFIKILITESSIDHDNT